MKILAALTLATLLAPGTASAICSRTADDTPEKEISKAAIVFVATINGAQVKRGKDGLPDLTRKTKHSAYYTVQYSFDVAIPIKGDPALVPYLTTVGIWQDAKAMQFATLAEQSKFVPGDSVLVVADEPGDAPISDIGCTPSTPWGPAAKDLLKRTQLLPT